MTFLFYQSPLVLPSSAGGSLSSGLHFIQFCKFKVIQQCHQLLLLTFRFYLFLFVFSTHTSNDLVSNRSKSGLLETKSLKILKAFDPLFFARVRWLELFSFFILHLE